MISESNDREKTGEGVGAALKIFNLVSNENLNYIYRGNFTKDFTRNIIGLAENSFKDENAPADLKRKVYHVMVEGVQNISRHQAKPEQEDDIIPAFFAIKRETDKYLLATGNLVENAQIENLTIRIDEVNNLSKDELKVFHKQVLKSGRISEKGGAGLGLIDIARRSGEKINFHFKPINDELSYFYLLTEITTDQTITENQKSTNENSLLKIIDLHPLLNDENISIVFCNAFYQEHLLDMLTFFNNQITDSNRLKRQIFNVMIEMFQNIIKHGFDVDGSISQDKKGIFYISEDENHIYLTSGNYIENNIVTGIKEHIDYTNSLDRIELDIFYKRRLFDMNLDKNKSAGLGLIDLKIKSGNQLLYNFHEINNVYSFFTLKVQILKQE